MSTFNITQGQIITWLKDTEGRYYIKTAGVSGLGTSFHRVPNTQVPVYIEESVVDYTYPINEQLQMDETKVIEDNDGREFKFIGARPTKPPVA